MKEHFRELCVVMKVFPKAIVVNNHSAIHTSLANQHTVHFKLTQLYMSITLFIYILCQLYLNKVGENKNIFKRAALYSSLM